MKITTLLIGLILSFAGVTASAADCVSKAEMTEIASHFKQFSAIAQKDYCFDGSQTSNLLSSIMFMRKTPFAADMQKSQDELFSGRFAKSWYQYFIGRIDDMSIESSCPPGVAAFVYGFGGHTMYVCPSLLTDNFSSLDRASVFMHEARHIDGYPHMTCSQGARKGIQGACDTRISEGGSYAVTVETYAQLAKYATDLNPALKAYARASAVVYADEAFETPVKVERGSELLAMTNAGDFLGLNFGATTTSEALGKTPALGHIAMRAQHMILFPDDKTLPAKYVFVGNAGDISQAAGDGVIEYNGQTPAQRAELVDYHVAAQWNAKVYKSKVKFVCNTQNGTISELAFPADSQAVSILALKGYDRVSTLSYIMTTSGTLYDFGCDAKSKAVLKVSAMKLDQVYKRVHKAGDKIVGLTNDGHLFEIKNGQSTALASEVDGQIYEIAPRQTFNFFDSAK